jgi:iron complex outermembrane receptor protein
VFGTTRVGTSDQFSEELRMTSKLDSWFNYVAGLYYFKSRYTLNPQIASLLGTPIQDLTAAQDSKSYAAFTETYWDVAPKTRLTVGARYTREEKVFQITSFNTFAPQPYPIVYTCPDPTLAAIPALAACRDPTVTFSKVTPRVSLDYKFTPDLMLYGTFSQGFRSGGWDGRATSPTSIGPYAPETVDNYEIGIRSEWFNHRLRTNFTLFDEKYKNKQEEVLSAAPDAPAGTIETETKNAAAATLEGMELEVSVVPIENVSLYASAGYLNAHYDKFLQLDPTTGITTDVTNTRNLRYAPRWTANGGGNWKIPVPQLAGRIIATANYKWTADVFGSPIIDTTGLNRDVVPGYGVFDTSLTYEHPLANARSIFRTSAYVNDAFHGGGRESSSLDAGVFYFANVVQARTVGVEIQFEY